MKRHFLNTAYLALTFSVLIMSDTSYGGEPDTQNKESITHHYKYQPAGTGIESHNGNGRFNRPLYSSVEREHRLIAMAGDRPELMLMRISATKLMNKLANVKLGFAEGLWFDQIMPVFARYDKGLQHYRVGEQDNPVEIDAIRSQSFEGLLLRVRYSGKSVGPLTLAIGGRGSANYDQNPVASAFNPQECVGTQFQFVENVLTFSGNGDTLFATGSEPLIFKAADPRQVGEGPQALLESSVQDAAVGTLVSEWPETGVIYLIITTDKPDSEGVTSFLKTPEDIFAQALEENNKLATAVEIDTPDPYLNAALPAALLGYSAAWNAPAFYHGAIAWHRNHAGWRSTYGGTVAGWHDKVQSHMHAFFKKQSKDGRIPPNLERDVAYNMNEVMVDQALYDYTWTGNLEPLRNGGFDAIANHLAWGEKYVKTPDGLYENYLNAWNTDYKWSNGGGGTIASTYYWLANRTMADIAQRLGRDPSVFRERADEIATAMRSGLWSERVGVFGEYRDRHGFKLLHDSPDLSSIYTPIDRGFSNPFESYRMLRFALRRFEKVTDLQRGGALIYSSEWLPNQYSTRDLYTAEIINMLLGMYLIGQSEMGEPYRLAIDGSFFTGPGPGSTGYAMNPDGTHRPHTDFTDTTSPYIRTLVEGLFGVQMNAPDNRVILQPVFPREWSHASIRCPAVGYRYTWNGSTERISIKNPRELIPSIRLRARRAEIVQVTVNGKPANYEIEPGIGYAWVVIAAPGSKQTEVTVEYGTEELPEAALPKSGVAGKTCTVRLDRGSILKVRQSSGMVEDVGISSDGTTCTIPLPEKVSVPTFFVLVQHMDAKLWIPVEVDVYTDEKNVTESAADQVLEAKMVDLSLFSNQRLENLHKNRYEPQSQPFYWSNSAGRRTVDFDGRIWWEKRQGMISHNTSELKAANGRFVTDKGIPFAVPAEGKDAVFTSLYDNFPDRVEIPVNLRGRKLFFLVAASVSIMQSRMDNGHITVLLDDGTKHTVVLRDPETIDDWLGSGKGKPYLESQQIQTPMIGKNTHAVVLEMDLGEKQMIKSVILETRTNETMIGMLGVTVM